jgi:excisionase family DNA binding protein
MSDIGVVANGGPLKQEKLLNKEEVAERLGVKVRYVTHLVYMRRLDYVKVGRHLRFEERAIARFIDDGRVEAA